MPERSEEGDLPFAILGIERQGDLCLQLRTEPLVVLPAAGDPGALPRREVDEGAGDHHLPAGGVTDLEDGEAVVLRGEYLPDDLDRSLEPAVVFVEEPDFFRFHPNEGSRPVGEWSRIDRGNEAPRLERSRCRRKSQSR